jgi:hypothetical protein
MKTVRYYDRDTEKTVNIPEAETTDRTVEGRLQGVEGEVHFDTGLSNDLVERIKRIAATFAEVHPDPLKKWIYDFGRDQNPEMDIGAFDMMATVYEQVVGPSDTLARKQEVYGTLLGCSHYLGGVFSVEKGKDFVWKGRKYKHLKKAGVMKVCDAWLAELGRWRKNEGIEPPTPLIQ